MPTDVIAEGSGWRDLWHAKDELEMEFVPGDRGRLTLSLPLAVPQEFLDLVASHAAQAGTVWIESPHADGENIVMVWEKRNPGFVAVLMAIAAVLAAATPLLVALAALILFGSFGWQLARIRPDVIEKGIELVRWGVVGIAGAGLLLLLRSR